VCRDVARDGCRSAAHRDGCQPAIRPETLGSVGVSKSLVPVNWLQALVAIILGNVVYFLLMPSLPPVARHHRFQVDLGTLIDFWFCLVAYGLIRTARRWR